MTGCRSKRVFKQRDVQIYTGKRCHFYFEKFESCYRVS
jgi:hypothetical protein